MVPNQISKVSMLVIEISKKKKAPVTVISYSGSYKPTVTPGQRMYSQFQDRQNIIDTLLKECKYSVGDIVQPVNDVGKKKYTGKIVVTNILTKYSQFGKDEKWPDSNNPMIVEAKCEDGTFFWCTVNYLEKVNVTS